MHGSPVVPAPLIARWTRMPELAGQVTVACHGERFAWHRLEDERRAQAHP